MSERFLDKLFQAFEDTAVEQQQAAPIVTPVDGDDMTWEEGTLSKDTAIASESALSKVWANDDFDDSPLTYAALVKTVYRLQNEMAGLAAQVVELRERMDRNEADS